MGVVVSAHGRVTVVTLDWPERRNAVGPVQAAQIASAIESACAEGASGLVITGNGAFCAGGDLVAIMELVSQGGDAVREAVYGRFQRLPRALLSAPVPVFAALDGPAVGLGMDLALACDERFLGPNGWMRQGWGALGLIPGTGGELLLRRLNPTLVWRLLGAGEKVDGAAAEGYGLGRSAADGGLQAALSAMEALLRTVPADALRAYADLHRRQLLAELDAHLQACLDHQVALLTSERFAEQASAILGRS